MLVLTGREAHTLPPAVVRGLFWRIYAERAIPLLRAAQTPLDPGASVQAKIDHAELVTAAAAIEAELFPDG